jgi:hypothetical protein
MSKNLPSGLARCRLYADYARALLAERTGKGPAVKPSPKIQLDVKGELETIVGRVVDAWDNKGEYIITKLLGAPV